MIKQAKQQKAIHGDDSGSGIHLTGAMYGIFGAVGVAVVLMFFPGMWASWLHLDMATSYLDWQVPVENDCLTAYTSAQTGFAYDPDDREQHGQCDAIVFYGGEDLSVFRFLQSSWFMVQIILGFVIAILLTFNVMGLLRRSITIKPETTTTTATQENGALTTTEEGQGVKGNPHKRY